MSEEIIAVSKADVSTVLRECNVRELEVQNLTAICTVKGDTPEEKALVFNAANNPQHKINDFINKKIMVKDFYAETLELVNEKTGEVEKAPRIVLIDDQGEAYECVSVGMFSSLKKLIAIFGSPTWETPLPVIIKQEKVKNGTMLTMCVQY